MMSVSRKGTVFVVVAVLLLLLLDDSLAIDFRDKASQPDPYKVLGVKRTATDDEIQKAYRRKAKETHPDKNPSPHANEEFRRVTDAFETLGDPAERKRYDAQQRREAQRRRNMQQQERRREEMRRQQESKKRKERQRKQREMAEKARGTQSRVLKISSMDQFERALLDSSRRVYATNCLIMFVSNKNAERTGDEEYYFPYPFAGEAGRANSYEGMLRTAKVRFNTHTDLTRLFRAKSGSNSPHFVFARKGDLVGQFQIFYPKKRQGGDVHGDFKKWVESLHLAVAIVANHHSLPVGYLILRGGRVVHHGSLEPNYQESLFLHAQDRILAYDERLDSFPGAAGLNHANVVNAKGALLLDVFVTSDGTYAIPKRRCYDLSVQCLGWTRTPRGNNNLQCHRNPEFMHHICPHTCGVCGEHFASDLGYFAMHYPSHRLPSFLQSVASSVRRFAEDVGSMAKLRKNAAAAFFMVGYLVPFGIVLFRSESSPHMQGAKDPNSNLILLLDSTLLMLGMTICAGTNWVISTPIYGMPPWLRGFHRDLTGIATYLDIFMLLLGAGVMAFVEISLLTTLSRPKNGKLNHDELLFFVAALLTVVGSVVTALVFRMSSDTTQAIRWQHLWRYRKTAAFFIFVVGIFVGVALAALMRLSKPLRKKAVFPVIISNLVVLAAISGLALFDSHFKGDIIHVMELRKNAAFAFVVFGVLTGKVAVRFLCGKG